MHIGQNIRRLRNFCGLKQQEIAKRLRMTQQNYSLIENSKEVDENNLERLCDILGCDSEFIRNLPETPYLLRSLPNWRREPNYFESDFSDGLIDIYDNILKAERCRIERLEKLIKALKGKSNK